MKAPVVVCVVAVVFSASMANAELSTSDQGLINLWLLNEQTSGNVNNRLLPFEPQIFDTAPVGSAQNHDDLNDFPSDGPAWATGTDFEVAGQPVGTGTGLLFNAGELDRARVVPWMPVSQGDYSDGGGFTIMVRAYLDTDVANIDGVDFDLFGAYPHYMALQGTSQGNTNVIAQLRGGNDGPFWTISSDVNQFFGVEKSRWYNIFLVYEQNTSLTVAADDGTTFASRTDTNVPSGFDTSTGFGDSNRHWTFGAKVDNLSVPASPFDGRIESIAVWDRPLSLAELDDIDFVNTDAFIPRDCAQVISAGFGLAADFDEDCTVESDDLNALAGQWTTSNDPQTPGHTQTWPISGLLDTTDTSIISLYTFDELTSGNLENNPDPFVPAFTDTAPTGTAQNHDNFNDDPSDGPAYESMPVGTGTGLTFDLADNDRTRAAGWMNVAQGNYTEGGSFTIMVRLNAAQAADNAEYDVYVNGSTSGLRLEGTSFGELVVTGRVRDGNQNGGTETYFDVSSGAGDVWTIPPGTWHNVFLIYEANTSVTVAADDGTTFESSTNTTIPPGFDSALHGFSDSDRHWLIATDNVSVGGTYDGMIESIVLFDRALTLAEADELSLQNVPADCSGVAVGGYLLAEDLDENCVVNLGDFAAFTGSWLECNIPGDSNCTVTWPLP